LLEIFESQHDGVKDYTGGTLGRRRANATFSATVDAEEFDNITNVIELSELVSGSHDMKSFCEAVIGEFKAEVLELIE